MIKDRVRDKPFKAPFVTWEADGGFCHAVGLVQMAERGYTENYFSDPPVLVPALQKWCDDHEVKLVDFIVGPPHFFFRNEEIALKFEKRWHKTAWRRTLLSRIVNFFKGYHRYKHNTKVLFGADIDFFDYLCSAIFGSRGGPYNKDQGDNERR